MLFKDKLKKTIIFCTSSLASVHAAAYAYQTALGGALSFLSRFPLIKEDNMPKAKLMKVLRLQNSNGYRAANLHFECFNTFLFKLIGYAT
jgi:hypothetical protein